MREKAVILLKSIPIGISFTLPGISGGTMALILGIFDKLVQSIKKGYLPFLIPVVLGVVLGIWLGSQFITYLLEYYYNATLAFLFGLILFSVKVTLKEVSSFTAKGFIVLIITAVVAAIIAGYSSQGFLDTEIKFYHLFIAGFISSAAMILPGISGATLLVMIGIYSGVMEAVKELNFFVLFFYVLGSLGGMFSCSWFLTYLLKEYRSLTMMVLTGLILGSSRAVIPETIGLIEIFAFIAGAGLILLMSCKQLSKAKAAADADVAA